MYICIYINLIVFEKFIYIYIYIYKFSKTIKNIINNKNNDTNIKFDEGVLYIYIYIYIRLIK